MITAKAQKSLSIKWRLGTRSRLRLFISVRTILAGMYYLDVVVFRFVHIVVLLVIIPLMTSTATPASILSVSICSYGILISFPFLGINSGVMGTLDTSLTCDLVGGVPSSTSPVQSLWSYSSGCFCLNRVRSEQGFIFLLRR